MKFFLASILFLAIISSSEEPLTYLPPYEKRNLTDTYVSEFLKNKECSIVDKNLNRDILGRQNQNNQESTTLYCIEPQMLVDIVSLDFDENASEPISGRYENSLFYDIFFLNGKLIEKEDYFKYIKGLKKNDELKIKRVANSGTGDVILGYNMLKVD